MHEVFKSLPNQNDEMRSNVNKMVRHRSPGDKTMRSPETRMGSKSPQTQNEKFV